MGSIIDRLKAMACFEDSAIPEAVIGERSRFDPKGRLIDQLKMARQEKVLEHLHKLGVHFQDGDTVETMHRKMEIMSVTIEEHVNSEENPRENFLIICHHGKPVVGISQPFITADRDIKVRIIDPGANRLVISGVSN